MTRNIEYKLVRDEDMPPLVITKNNTTGITVILNENEKIWLSLHRNTIPAIAQQLQEKLTQICDGHLAEQLMWQGEE